MRMAKPSEKDIDAAYKLLGILDTIDSRFGGPWPIEGPASLDEALKDGDDFDPQNSRHLVGLYNSLAALLRTAPGFEGRVIGGMCAVICYEKNRIINPNDDCLDLHPDLKHGLSLLEAQRASGMFIDRLADQAIADVRAFVDKRAAVHLSEMQDTWTREVHREQASIRI